MGDKVCYWDAELGAQLERDMTEEEQDELDARRSSSTNPALLKAKAKAALQAQIDSLEAKSLMNRVIREKFLIDCVERDGQIRALKMSEALGRPVTLEEALATSVGYVKISQLNDVITALRTQMEAL